MPLLVTVVAGVGEVKRPPGAVLRPPSKIGEGRTGRQSGYATLSRTAAGYLPAAVDVDDVRAKSQNRTPPCAGSGKGLQPGASGVNAAEILDLNLASKPGLNRTDA